MRNLPRAMAVLGTFAALSLFAAGCEREIAHTEETEIKDDGTVKSKEKTVTQDSEGRTTVTEERKTEKPD